jgi:hypothetical protein
VAVPVPKGYSNKYLVADAIGTHDGVAPVQSLDYWLAAAEAWIDKYTGQTWGITGVTAEQHTFDGSSASVSYQGYNLNPIMWVPRNGWGDPLIYLRTYPVAAVSAVRARYLNLAAVTYTLVPADYELVDAAHGQLLVSTNWFGQRLSIDYTVTVPIPADITLAATLLVTAWVSPMVNGTDSKALSGIKSYSIGQDLSVTFQDNASSSRTMAAPANVVEIVEQYCRKAYVT